MYPNEDGCCPKCNINILEIDDKYILVKHEQWLPSICAICGEKADTYERVKATKNERNDNFIIQIIMIIVSVLLIPFRILFVKTYKDYGVYHKVDVRIPLCKYCKKANTIEAEFVDFEENQMAINVHEKLKVEFLKMEKYIHYKEI